jgi:hypothetical protein
MDPLVTNPFAVLTFIAAPAILTNASSVMALGTSNRFARAVDRVRTLARELREQGASSSETTRLRLRQFEYAQRRMRLLVRALTCFYFSLGGFAAASFTSLLGAVFVISGHGFGREVAMLIAFGCGVAGIGGLMSGSALLIWESRFTIRVLRQEAELIVRELGLNGPSNDAGIRQGLPRDT